MKYLLLTLIIIMSEPLTLFDFTKEADLSNWYIVNDTVMGGISNATFNLDTEGHGHFQGNVSTENNGGFSSVRYDMRKIDVSKYSMLHLRIKGDGKRYQMRLQENQRDRFSYIKYFDTTGEWEDITLRLSDFEAYFRGTYLNKPNYTPGEVSGVSILIGNGKNQAFDLLIDEISFVYNTN